LPHRLPGHEAIPPLRIDRRALNLDAPIPVRGDVSSQFLTALLMALPWWPRATS
jgi:3-phosphoshikimate 1-carboxyvinyltransferase